MELQNFRDWKLERVGTCLDIDLTVIAVSKYYAKFTIKCQSSKFDLLCDKKGERGFN